jgi:hypothetical protein
MEVPRKGTGDSNDYIEVGLRRACRRRGARGNNKLVVQGM